MKTNNIYNVDYFIKKFSAIPEELWITGDLGHNGHPRCANGHLCGDDRIYTDKMDELRKVFLPLLNKITIKSNSGIVDYIYIKRDEKGDRKYSRVAETINNGDALEYQQPTPKQRILAALYDIKKLQEKPAPTPEPEYRTVVIDTKVKQLTQEKIYQS